MPPGSRDTILLRQVDALHELIAEVRERIREQNATIDKLREEKTELLEEKLRKDKGYNALVKMADDYGAVEADNERMRGERAALREHMQALLRYTKALQNAYRIEA